MKICVITDNIRLFKEFKRIFTEKCAGYRVEYFCSTKNTELFLDYSNEIKGIDLKGCDTNFFDSFELFISAHCKQIFPNELVDNYRCINIHPGLNPYNRGLFPQVFSIINGLPVGATIHEMDRELDHGAIIFQKEVEVFSYDTAETVYKRIIDAEVELLREHLVELVIGDYQSIIPREEGNINNMSDFRKLCELDMDHVGSLKEHIDLLRATTFIGYKNAYYFDKDKKIYVSIFFEGGGILNRHLVFRDKCLSSQLVELEVAA